MKKHVTIKDVARELNVSISTISRAFNDKYDIRPETKERILHVAHEMGYVPNPMAQNLTQNKRSLIGVVVPEFINSFFPRVISGIQEVFREVGYQVLIMSSNEQADQELENMKVLERNMVDGIILSFTQETRDVSYYQILNKNIPIVQFNRVSQKLDSNRVYFDDYTWSIYATEHLIKQGYKNIYHVLGPASLIITQKRKKGFLDALAKHSIKQNEGCFLEGGIFIEDGNRVAQEILAMETRPDALFCFNDPLAIGIMEELKKNGVKMPDEIALVGFTESRIAKHTTPSLTSVEQPAEEMGRIAAKLLLKELTNGYFRVAEDIVLNGVLNVRSSSLRL
ncbi:MAG: LacI family DNA-binding transcriptional regulator [Phocaeicola sp.]